MTHQPYQLAGEYPYPWSEDTNKEIIASLLAPGYFNGLALQNWHILDQHRCTHRSCSTTGHYISICKDYGVSFLRLHKGCTHGCKTCSEVKVV